MANLQGGSPLLGPETAVTTASSRGTVTLLGCKSLTSGLGQLQEGHKLSMSLFYVF